MSGAILTARAVADLFNVCPETVLRWTRRGELPAIKLPGGAIRYSEEEIDRWLAERATPGRGSVSHPVGTPPGCRLAVSATPENEED